MSSGKEKGKKVAKRTRDVDGGNPSEFGETIDALSGVEVKMRLEAMDNFGKWYLAKVLEVDEDSRDVLVHFDRWSSRYDEYIPIGGGRLRRITPSRLLELQKDREPVYIVGDRVQAKWEDGKMYFGKVIQVNEDSVDVLFDDGVEYTAPLRSVRKRRAEKHENSLENIQSSSDAEARRSRAMKRSRNDDSTSQSSMSSPPSSPPSAHWSKRPCRRILDSDSTETESDFEDTHNPHIGESPLKPKEVVTSSDGEQSIKKTRRKKLTMREPYKLRKATKLEPLKEDEVKTPNDGMESEEAGLGALLTPPTGDTSFTEPTPKPPPPPPQSKKESPKPIPNPTPPETPQTDSHSKSGILKRMLSQEDMAAAETKKSEPGTEDATSPSRKKPPVSSRTRAQTKFENVSKKSDKKDTKKQMKTAPKEMVIIWDHNKFKCKVTGCNKSFRKESLLQSHVKHYHTKETKIQKPPTKPRGFPGKVSLSPKSPQSQTSPLSPSHFSLSPNSPPVSHDEAVKSPTRGRKPKSILSPTPRRNPSRSKTSEIENREKSPTESFFEFIEKEKKSGEVMQLLEQATKQQKTSASFRLSTHAPVKSIDKAATFGHHHSTSGKAQPPPSSSSPNKTPGSSSKKMRQTTLNVSSPAIVAGPPQRSTAVEIRTLSRDSLSHSSHVVKTTSEYGSATPSCSAIAKSGQERQLNTSESVEDMDTSNEFEGGELLTSNTNEGSEEDVVHCVCGSIEDEGFMIQCEQCLCWQHGDCVGLTEETLPKKYICYICDNPPGLRQRYHHQFDHDWFHEGTLPGLPGAPKFHQAGGMKMTHQLSGQLYKLRKMMHSSKVKLQAANTVNHPYLKQWAKECSHCTKDDIISYIMRSLIPVSYPQRTSDEQGREDKESETAASDIKEETASDAERTDVASHDQNDVAMTTTAISSHNGTDESAKVGASTSSPIDVSSLHLDPLPRSPPAPLLPPTSYDTAANDPQSDPKSLQLAPLPPLGSEDHLVAVSKQPAATSLTVKEDVRGEKGLNSKPALASSSLEVFNDEFGIQETSVFATTTGQPQLPAPGLTNRPAEQNSARLISSSRSAFRPVIVTPRDTSAISNSRITSASSTQTSQFTATSTLARDSNNNVAESADIAKPKPGSEGVAVTPLFSLPSMTKSKSGMDSVTLGEFSEAFMKGDMTNWFQRMLLLDHIETIQDKVSTWMEIIDKQLDAIPDEGDSQFEDMESLLKNVQSSVEQLGKLQQAAATS